MSKYVDISQVKKLARDVTLANGIAKYRCIDRFTNINSFCSWGERREDAIK